MSDLTVRELEVVRAISQASEILHRNKIALATDIKCRLFVVDMVTGEETELVTDIGTVKEGEKKC